MNLTIIKVSRRLFILFLLVSPFGITGAQTTLHASAQKSSSKAGAIDQSLFNAMRWRQVGPFRGGRVLAVTGVPGEPNVFYFGAASGGVWKTVDAGVNWAPIFDHESIASIGAIAVAPGDHNTIYVGSGEACIRGNITYGNGVYKTTDGGRTWRNIGLRDTRHIGAVVIDPKNPNIVFVAALGHAYGPNEERGVFRTTDGGTTWQKVLYRDNKTGAIDVVLDQANPSTLFASLWEVYRTPWSLSSGGAGSGLYKSVDGGTTWKRLEGNGLPAGIMGRIGVSVAGGDSNRVYALIESKEGGLFRSDDGGEHWIKMNEDGRLRQRAWYFTHIFADPKSTDTLYVLNTGLFRSIDGGRTFNLLPAPHGDHHGLWIDPDHTERLINGNDGGATISIDSGKTWSTQYNQPTAQFYHVITDNQWPYFIYGAQQDNSSVAIKSYNDDGVIGRQDWFQVGGGECGYIAPYPPDPNIVFANSEYIVNRFDKRTEQSVDISPWPLDPSGRGAGELVHRFQWTSPLFISPHDPNTLYTAGEVVFKSTNAGQTWQTISPDLTRNDKSKQKPSGGPITLDITSVEYYDTVFALAESPQKKDMLWVGTDDGLVQLTDDGGKKWDNVTPRDLPEWSMISIIEPSHFDAASAYIAVDRHKLDDFRPFIYRTGDSGKSWTAITRGIPDGSYVRSVREDPKRKGLLFAGTETGVYLSLDDGANWQELKLNLPTVPIHDLNIHDDDLIVATHGRAFWVLDDITPLRQINTSSTNAEMTLYKPQPAIRLHLTEGIERRGPLGDDPPLGAIIDYYFRSAPTDEVKLEILDSSGKPVRSLSSKENKQDEQPPEWPDQLKEVTTIPSAAGMNRYAWNMRSEPPVKIPGAFYTGNGPQGPLALPGTYTIKLTVGSRSVTQPLEIVMDPRVKNVSSSDLRQQFELAMQVRDANTELHRAVNEVRELRAQIKQLHARFDSDPKMKPLLENADSLDHKMQPVEEALIQVNMKGSEGNLAFPNMLNEAFDSFRLTLDYADNAPTAQQLEVFKLLRGQLDKQLTAWRQIKSTDVVSFNALSRSSDLPLLYLSPEK